MDRDNREKVKNALLASGKGLTKKEAGHFSAVAVFLVRLYAKHHRRTTKTHPSTEFRDRTGVSP